MGRKTNTGRSGSRGRGRRRTGDYRSRTARPRPKVDFTIDALEYLNTNLLRQFVTDAGRMLPRKYTGLPARFQRRMTLSIKRARQALLMK